MKPFIVISCLVLAAMAKPQGYSYSVPSSAYSVHSAGLSAPSAAALSVALLPPHTPSHISSVSAAPSYSHGLVSSHGSLGLPSHSSGGSLSLGSSYSVASHPSYTSFSSAPSAALVAPAPALAPPSPLPAPSFASAPSFSSGPSFAPAQTFVPSLPVQSSNTLIQKHIYVHVPPPEEEERAPVLQLQPQSRQKHYKIIFIKAPSAPSVSQQLLQAQLAQQQQTEEKTLVYVLVKKPDSIEEIQQSIPRVPLTQPNKPEVYFIKYKAQSGLSAPSFVQPSVPSVSSSAVDLALSGLSSGSQTTTVLSPATDSSSAAVAAAAAAATSSSSSVESSLSQSSATSGGDIASITTVIEPRKPAEKYGPPN